MVVKEDAEQPIGCSLSGRVSVPKPLSQIQRSTRWLLQGLSPTSFGGFGLYAICPGFVDTERLGIISAKLAPEDQSAEEYHAEVMRQRGVENPMGRVAQASDIARMAAFLASSESDYMTGLAITVSGGSVMA